MRDPDRIDRVCEKLRLLWHRYPDQRLGQLIENYVIPSGEMRGPLTSWLFQCEDDATEENLNKKLKENA